MRLLPLVAPAVACALLAAGAPAHAQDAPRAETVVAQENVRYDYAQVLGVNPIYQVLRTTRMEPRCEDEDEPDGRLSRVVGAVRGVLGTASRTQLDDSGCEMVPVTRDFRRPIAYDVDYVYKGSKFRTRLGQDPGNRLRVRVSITPEPVP